VIERLSARGVRDRVTAARIIGALRISEATPWLSALLIAHDSSVAEAAARALGRIGGTRSAAALMLAIQRKGMSRRLVSELARSAPDLFIEVALQDRHKPPVRPALAIAAGLRRRHTAVTQLIALVQEGSRRERVIGCRALGWIGARTAIPVIREALGDRDWKIRVAAAKALGALHASSCRPDLEPLLADRNPRVRQSARHALRRMETAHGA
jgi:HEAT repeat protein